MTIFANSVYFFKHDEGRQFFELLRLLEEEGTCFEGTCSTVDLFLDFLLRILIYESHRSSSGNSQ